MAAERLAALLGSAPVVRATAPSFPVDVRHLPPARGERIETCAARAARRALADGDGDVLVFLPGAAEINRVAERLTGTDGVDVLPLHGRLPAAAQDAALRPGPRRRVVLATAVAESSLTVPGVRAVVDAGLARVPRTDHRRGLAGLATVRVSAAVADQRAGRAGREGPGRVYRCWPEHEHGTLPAYPEPEIRAADLTRLALELACWGTPDGAALTWWDPPPAGALAAGREVLAALGALRGDGGVTERGRRMAGLGLHPRLARALLDGAAEVGAAAAAEVVALLDDDGLAAGVDLAAALRRLRAGDAPGAARWRREARRLATLVAAAPPNRPAPAKGAPRNAADAGTGRSAGPLEPAGTGGTAPPRRAHDDPATVVALAYPERLARRRSAGTAVYLMAGGTAVELPPGRGLADAEWLAVAVADREPGRAHGRIRLAARAGEDLATRAAPALLATADEVAWADGDVRARRVHRLGAIVLAERPLADPDPAALRDALIAGLRAAGPGLLRWDTEGRRLRERLAFLHRVLGPPWPAVDDASLLSDVDIWLGPELATARRRADLERLDAGAALRRLLPWPDAARLDELAPDRLPVPSGSRLRVDYSADDPVLPVRVQEAFGWSDTPRLAGGRVPVRLHLLSPAGRPVAVTTDLASFWRTGYPEVRAQLRGRYPRHAWPDDPTAATPTRR
ncbi:ATP-dependent helicase [Gandjariella thermophila]|uniref:ATP-dependent helicase n=1 Tax=Gandjariella thermophila TaxID=1931992 RepID=A0A4D4JG95_9PSEU|nr:ATP-dependent helicase [Gandjariella thermophila]